MLPKVYQFSVICMVTIGKITVSSMDATRQQTRVCYHGQRLVSFQKFLLPSKRCLITLGVSSNKTNSSLIRPELLSGMK